MEETISTLMKLCENRRKGDDEFKAFQTFVEELSLDKVEQIITERIGFLNGPQVINSLLLGLSLKSQSQKKRMRIFEMIMSEIQEKDVPTRNASTVLTWLVVELEKLSSAHLLRISDLCVSYVATTSQPNRCCWKDLLPKMLSLIVNKKEVDHYGSEKSGEEYKKQVVTSLLQSKWHPAVLTSLASMFIYVPLSTEEHESVVVKLCHGLTELSPPEVPPLVHQLLLLTKSQHSMILFFSLKEYYDKHLYRLEESLNVVDSTNLEAFDAIEAVSRKEVVENQNVVLYHIEDSAKSTLGSTQEMFKVAKSSVSAPESFLDPFLLSVLLSLSTLPMYQIQLMDTVKSTVLRAVLEDDKKTASDWLRKILTRSCDVQQILVLLIKSSSCEQESVVRGLVGLSMSLLKQAVGGRDVCHRVWTLGRMIAVNIVKRHHQVARTVLSTIADAVINRPDLTQYTECLAEVCDTSPLLVVESCAGVITRLLDVLPDLPPATAYKVISAVTSLTRVSSKIRDNLILVLRKSLFIHNESARKVAVFGFLQLLKRLKLRGFNSLSQNSFQIYTCPSILTQTVLDVHGAGPQLGAASGNNERICLEVINILKRCFMQQASVKTSLYHGVCKALLHNPELCAPVTSLLVEHFLQYYEPDEEVIPPVYFSKAIVLKNNQPVIQEPVGQLLYALNQVMVTAKTLPCQDDEELFNNQLKLEKTFESMIKRFGSCEPKHLQLDAEDMDEMKEEILKECLSVYEGLMMHMISGWDASAGLDQARTLMSLYRAYNSFLDLAKNVKPKAREVESGSVKSRGRPGVVATLQLPPTLFDFDTLHKLMSLYLLEDVDWCTDDVRDEMRSKKPLLRFAFHSCLDLLANTKVQLQQYRAKSVLNHISNLAKLLYERCLLRFEEVMDMDSLSAVSAIECLSEICSIVVSYFKSQLLKFLNVVCDKGSNVNFVLEKLIKSHLKVLGKVLDSEEDNQDELHFKKLSTALIQTVTTLSLELPVNETGIAKVVNWLSETARQKKVSSVAVAKSIVSLLLTLLLRSKSDSSLLDNLALHICEMFGSVNDVDVEKSAVSLNIVNHDTKAAIVPLVISSLGCRLDSIDWLIVRLRAELAVLSPTPLSSQSPKTRRCELKKREKEVVGEAGLVVSCCQWLCTAALPATLSEQVCKLLTRTYSTLTHLTKYFSIRASHQNPVYQEARFNKLVRLSASHLSSQMADFILYIEAVDENEEEKKLSRKVLNQAKKQTVYIPRLVAELENFTKCVTQLSNKCKDPSLTANMKLTTTRDFRLNTKRLEEVMKRRREEEETEDEEASSNIDNVSSVLQDNTSQGSNRITSQETTNTSQSSNRGKGRGKKSQTSTRDKESQASTKEESQGTGHRKGSQANIKISMVATKASQPKKKKKLLKK